jgi:DNA invertase Pin-like site-specific DNA recombinase
MNSDVESIAVDMLSANRLTIHILAAVAEHEREMISQRSKAALAASQRHQIRQPTRSRSRSEGQSREKYPIGPA